MYIDGKTKGGTVSSSILDSPSLRRIVKTDDNLSNHSCQSNTLSRHTVQKGLLWQQRDRIFSRWKERYFVLTPDYLNCFRKASDSGADRISDMGHFMFKVKLVDVDRVEWANKKNYSIIILHLAREGRILLRSDVELENWFENLEDCRVKSCKRREMLRMSHDSYHLRDRENDEMSTLNSGNEDWLLTRSRIAHIHRSKMTDSAVDLTSMAASMTTGSGSGEDDEKWHSSSRQRHSLLTNLDMNALDTPPPSVPPSLRGRTPCKLNSDIFFMSGTGRQRASIAGPVTHSNSHSLLRGGTTVESHSMLRGGADPQFRLPNMLHSTRGTANRYSYAEEKTSADVYSTYDARHKAAIHS